MKIKSMVLAAALLAAGLCAAPLGAAETSPTAALSPASATEVSSTTVVVRVNGEDLTRGQLDQMVSRNMGMIMQRIQMSGQPVSPERIAMIRKMNEAEQVDIWTDNRILSDAIKPYDVQADPKKVDETIDMVRQQVAMQGAKLEDVLTSRGMSIETLHNEISDQLKFQAGLVKLVEDKDGSIEPKPEDLEELRTSHILIGFNGSPRDGYSPDEEEKAAKKKNADEVLAELKAGGDFAELAKKYSTSERDAALGGDLDFHPRGFMVKQYDDVAWNLKEGEISDLVETPFGFHIIKATGRRTNDSAENRERLIQEKLSEKIPPILDELRKTAKIEDLRPESDRVPLDMMMAPPMGAPAEGGADPHAGHNH